MLTALRTNHFVGAPCTAIPRDQWDVFHPSAGTAYKIAKRVCAPCPVKKQCLEWVLSFEHADERVGVFGGLTARERERLFRGPRRDEVMCIEGHPLVEGDKTCKQCDLDRVRKRNGCTLTGPPKKVDESWASIAKRLRKSHPYPGGFSSKHDYDLEQI